LMGFDASSTLRWTEPTRAATSGRLQQARRECLSD